MNIILDHLGRPEVLDGPPYTQAGSLFALAALPNINLKLTPRIFGDVTKGKASAETFFPRSSPISVPIDWPGVPIIRRRRAHLLRFWRPRKRGLQA